MLIFGGFTFFKKPLLSNAYLRAFPMKKLLPVITFFLASCASDPIRTGTTDSLVSNEVKMNSDSAKTPTDPIRKIDYEVEEINNGVLNGNLKRKGFDDQETTLGWLYAYYENDSTPTYIYAEQKGELSSEQTIFYLKEDKLICVDIKHSTYGKDASGETNTNIKVPYYDRHLYFDGETPLMDTIVMTDGSVKERNYDFLKDLITAKKLLRKAKVAGPR